MCPCSAVLFLPHTGASKIDVFPTGPINQPYCGRKTKLLLLDTQNFTPENGGKEQEQGTMLGTLQLYSLYRTVTFGNSDVVSWY